MIIGPVSIQWTKDVVKDQADVQRLDMRRNKVMSGLERDNQAMRHTLKQIFDRGASKDPKPPKGAGANDL